MGLVKVIPFVILDCNFIFELNSGGNYLFLLFWY